MIVLKEKNLDWIKELKPGDKVACDVSNYSRTKSYKIYEIAKITPTGIIKMTDGSQWNKDGSKRGDTGVWRSYRRIEPITQEIKDSIEKEKRLAFISKTKFEDLPLDSLRQIIGIIESSNPQ